MARLFITSAVALFALSVTVQAIATATETDMQVTARHEGSDDSMPTKVVFACSKLTSKSRFLKCTSCTTLCGKRFGVKGTMIRHVVGHDSDGDGDDDTDKIMRLIYLCNRNERCLKCRAGCRRRFGLKKTIMPGGAGEESARR
ncbi:unnamed protein product [Chondrus crispus]|uniref:C2H2-type domain-containing protein n=1 Tax=Chondrus crispus TaxID=2769 RepID=R7QSV2_CHOCR|nr:unnamed protein product [Chondrus crispus]CDF41219.1 unnamed protein product [Chondrus crispus]|eukprot:XP_005711513.1 unnamed protein product [Chondrus crispus]